MKATKIYRDNFVYNINTPLCIDHATNISHSLYSYVENFDGDQECAHCEFARRQKAFEANKIEWKLLIDGVVTFESKDRSTFWSYIKSLHKSVQYTIIEKF